ncbi:DUF4253 domain-containing protein [Xanthobacter sp. AM11]|uniref:DUF4253 domain-containing protein n=1 Tax=Xanthobacter sp. AM11 TaxID=3380643 RepID=UPI0039BF3E87
MAVSPSLAAAAFPVRQVPAEAAADAWLAEQAAGRRAGFSPLLFLPHAPPPWADAASAASAHVFATDEIIAAYVSRLVYEEWALRQPGETPGFDAASPDAVEAALAAHKGHVPGDPYSYVSPDFDAVRERPAPLEPEGLRLRILEPPPSFSHPGPQVAIARIPTAESWRLPLFAGFGGWNAVPRPAEIAAFAQRWKRLHGADIAAITTDTMEFIVAEPPAAFEAARRLAMEHALFCPEDFGDLDVYVARLRTARTWSFWWD